MRARKHNEFSSELSALYDFVVHTRWHSLYIAQITTGKGLLDSIITDVTTVFLRGLEACHLCDPAGLIEHCDPQNRSTSLIFFCFLW